MKKDNTTSTKKQIFKPVYLCALFPILSTALYLLVMGTSTTEDFGFGALAIIGFIAVTAAWGYIGALFARTRNLLLPSAIIAHILPTITTVIYTVLYLIAQVNESTELEDLAVLIGGLGTGFFGILGTLLYAIIPLSLFEVYINFVYSILVFIIGFAIGASTIGKKRDIASIKNKLQFKK
ncbi:MAG: hypothetical protein IJY37_05120 [Clostridia bacterium]|nr:hypothetical protein [Clostridia bacterium]MBP3555101.1 hypothetical protein [Clostridia bacterium]MBQ8419714.1 hypothetical protein [Clostridia bacterium]